MFLDPDWLLTPHRAVVHRPTHTGVIADLHLGYAAARQANGEVVPNLSEEFLLQRVLRLLDDYGLQRLVIAGDLVEKGYWGIPAATRFLAAVGSKGVSVILVPGNHDRGLPPLPGLERVEHSFPLGTGQVIHHAEPEETKPCILGHLHPVVRSTVFNGQVPCYLLGERRLLLPAQSEDASGGNVLQWKDWQQAECHAIVNDEVLFLGTVATLRLKLKAKSRKK